MNIENEKCVIVMDESLPVGIIANTAAILGITMGMKMPDVVGCDVADAGGNRHRGIIQFPVPVLKGNAQTIRQLRRKLFSEEYADLMVADFTDLAQGCRTYHEFIEKMAGCPEEKLSYIGIAVCGEKRRSTGLPVICHC